MSLATASCDLWQKEQRRTSSLPVLVLTERYSFAQRSPGQGPKSPTSRGPSLPTAQSRAATGTPDLALQRALRGHAIAVACMDILKHNSDECAWVRSEISVQLLSHGKV